MKITMTVLDALSRTLGDDYGNALERWVVGDTVSGGNFYSGYGTVLGFFCIEDTEPK